MRAYMLLRNAALSQATYPPSETNTAQIKWQNFFLFKLIKSNRKDTKDHQRAWGKKNIKKPKSLMAQVRTPEKVTSDDG